MAMDKVMSKKMIDYIKGYFKTDDYKVMLYDFDPRLAILDFGIYENERYKEDVKFALFFYVRKNNEGGKALKLDHISISFTNYDFFLNELGSYRNERQMKSIAKALPEHIYGDMTKQFKEMHPDAIL